MKLNIGSGAAQWPGYVAIDRKLGLEAYPLDAALVPDESCDEIRASHVLEHFAYAEVQDVVKHWASKLKPGGVLKIAVPDFDWCVEVYRSGSAAPIEGYIMGGQTDGDDYHKSMFNESTLADYLRGAGLTDIKKWDSAAGDCSSLPVSLNMCAVKPVKIERGAFKIAAIMSMPRLGFTDNFKSTLTSLTKMGIEVSPFTGAYWGQCLERGLESAIASGVDAILTIDYDTVFTAENVQTLMRLMLLHPEADAIAPFQSARGWSSPLLTVMLPDGTSPERVPRELLEGDLMRLHTAHFGLTLIRVSALKDVPKPWFWSKPAPDGSWNEGHVDDDIYFWRQWALAGKTLYNANRVVVGHLELMIKWPGRDLGVIHQRAPDFWNNGAPKDTWK